ncbi:MAG: hypothetical protein MZV70_29145 [Desulfobacterales bacterium]|nr:hypothetical protein [Desulfobacterales bacterium]
MRGFFSAENSFHRPGVPRVKPHTSALFAVLWCIVHPGSKVLVLARNSAAGNRLWKPWRVSSKEIQNFEVHQPQRTEAHYHARICGMVD